jgi:phage baseplate assembly protein W
MGRGQEAAQMPQKQNIKRRSTRSTLRLPDLDHSKNSVLQSLGSAASKRTYGAAIEDFIQLVLLRATLGLRPNCGSAIQVRVHSTYAAIHLVG